MADKKRKEEMALREKLSIAENRGHDTVTVRCSDLRTLLGMPDKQIQCKLCGNNRPDQGECPHCGAGVLPDDYEPCGDCGFDHDYEAQEAYVQHRASD